jgi:hypothetical protein
MSSRSATLSAARSGSITTSRPTASSASARWTRVSWVVRRSQNPAVWSSDQVQTCVAGPTSRMVWPRRRAPATSQADRSSGSWGTRTRTWALGTGARRSRTTVTHRWACPTCSVSWARVHSGQVGTGRAGSASCTASANLAVSASSAAS